MSPAQARSSGRSTRYYADPVDGRRYASVTTITRATSSSDGLVDWAARQAAAYAIDHGPALADLGRDEAVEIAAGAPNRYRDAAGARGKAVHAVSEALALDAPIPAVDDDAQPYVDAFISWAIDYEVSFHAAEATVANPESGYAGTLDAIGALGALDGFVTLVDYKTGKSLDPELPMQLAAYEHATELWLPHGAKARMPEVDGAHVLHLHADGTYTLRPVNTAAAWPAFGLALDLYAWQRGARELIGRPTRRPGEPIPLRDVPGLGRCRRTLEAAGLTTVNDLTGWTEAQLLDLDGIGPAAVAAIGEALVDYDLTPAGAA